MGFTSFEGLRRVVIGSFVSALSLVFASGCGVQELPSEEQDPALQTQEQEIVEANGLNLNGLNLNGLNLNGLNLNGLNLNGLSTSDFERWFNSDPVGNEQLMKYLVECAIPAGESRSFRNPATGNVYTWPGMLGLSPDWAGGSPATEVEQQIVTACLGAHANNYGLHISISLLGRGARGGAIPFTSQELSLYGRRESCFFGNVFNQEGLFVGNDRNALALDESSSRPCGLKSYGALSDEVCPQLKRIGQCEQHCTLEPNGTYYAYCTFNGKQYKPLTTRMRPEDFHRCGDGVCQRSERCGNGVTANSCRPDCGTCAP